MKSSFEISIIVGMEAWVLSGEVVCVAPVCLDSGALGSSDAVSGGEVRAVLRWDGWMDVFSGCVLFNNV